MRVQILLGQEVRKPENGYKGNPVEFHERMEIGKELNNLITFQFKVNQTNSMHNGWTFILPKGQLIGHESEVYYSAPITCHCVIVGRCLSYEKSTLK